MASKFDQIIESIVNGDDKKARSMFHNFVVNRSRKIYESLEEEDPFHKPESGADDFVQEIESEEANSAGDDFADEDEFGGDAADDLVDDTEDAVADADVNDFDDDTHEEDVDNENVEDRVVDLEDELDQLKAEFAKLIGDEEAEGDDLEDIEDEDFDDSEEASDDFGDEDVDFDEESDDESFDDDSEGDDFAGEDEDFDDDFSDDDDDDDDDVIREYVEKVAKPSNAEAAGTNTKSTVAGKNDMGGSAKNIAQSGKSTERSTPKAEVKDFGNVNVPGSKTADKLKKVAKPGNEPAAGTNSKSVY